MAILGADVEKTLCKDIQYLRIFTSHYSHQPETKNGNLTVILTLFFRSVSPPNQGSTDRKPFGSGPVGSGPWIPAPNHDFSAQLDTKLTSKISF